MLCCLAWALDAGDGGRVIVGPREHWLRMLFVWHGSVLRSTRRRLRRLQEPFGYRAVSDVAPSGRVLGTKWTIHEPEAATDRKIYQWRKEGISCAGIAARLQGAGILPPGGTRMKAVPYRRQATVHRLLGNPIYRGVFTWNGAGLQGPRQPSSPRKSTKPPSPAKSSGL